MNLLCSEAENMSVSTNYYEFIKLIYENVSKYIKKYKEETSEYCKKISKIQERYITRLSGEEILKKIKNIDTEHIIYLSQLIFNIVKVQLTYLNIFIKEVDEIIKSFDKTLKEKNTMSSGYLNEYEDCKNNLQKKYKDIEKAKDLFFDNANITENLLINFYTPKIPNCKNPEIPIVTKSQIENSTKITKKNENDYSNLVKSAKACEDKFFSLTSNSIDNMTRISCDLTTKMKDNIVSLLLNLKNCFKLPLGEIDTYLPELVNLDENKKIEEIIKSSYKKDDKLIRVQLEKYEIKSIPKYDEDNKDEKFKYIIEDNEIINTINYMENNFNLIVKGSLSEINSPEKLRCRLLTYKLLSFSKKVQVEIKDLEKSEKVNNNKSNDDDKKNYSITDEEVKELYELLEKPENRTIFLKKLNNFRKFGDLEFPTREYYILGNVLNIISRNIKKDKNLENQLALVILSETYYKIEDNEKYLNGEENLGFIIEDDEIIKTIKTMESNFNLFEKGSISKINTPEKIRCKFFTCKLLSFAPKIVEYIKNLLQNNEINNINIPDDKNGDYSLNDDEIKELYSLLGNIENKMVFLKQINNFRKYGYLEFPKKNFEILCNIFNLISSSIIKDKYFEEQSAILILCETYYTMENDKKVYILDVIKKNKIFHEKEFWNDFINKSILKEVQRNLQNYIKEHKGDVSSNNQNYDKLVFAQILPIIKTMMEFELDNKKINELLGDLIAYYKLDKNSKKTLYDMVNFKGTKKQTEIKEKCERFLEISCIMEDEEEYKESVYETVKTINELKLQQQNKEENKIEKEEKEEKEKKEENEEKKEKEEDFNELMIKNVNTDEFDKINQEMIKDDIEEENEEEIEEKK